jgi:hypothetical protein
LTAPSGSFTSSRSPDELSRCKYAPKWPDSPEPQPRSRAPRPRAPSMLGIAIMRSSDCISWTKRIDRPRGGKR